MLLHGAGPLSLVAKQLLLPRAAAAVFITSYPAPHLLHVPALIALRIKTATLHPQTALHCRSAQPL
jgi:hypothetical protein